MDNMNDIRSSEDRGLCLSIKKILLYIMKVLMGARQFYKTNQFIPSRSLLRHVTLISIDKKILGSRKCIFCLM
jgi:hypothetical protein